MVCSSGPASLPMPVTVAFLHFAVVVYVARCVYFILFYFFVSNDFGGIADVNGSTKTSQHTYLFISFVHKSFTEIKQQQSTQPGVQLKKDTSDQKSKCPPVFCVFCAYNNLFDLFSIDVGCLVAQLCSSRYSINLSYCEKCQSWPDVEIYLI